MSVFKTCPECKCSEGEVDPPNQWYPKGRHHWKCGTSEGDDTIGELCEERQSPDYKPPYRKTEHGSYACCLCGYGTFGSPESSYFKDVCRLCLSKEVASRGGIIVSHPEWNDQNLFYRRLVDVVRAAEAWVTPTYDEFGRNSQYENDAAEQALFEAVRLYVGRAGDREE